LVGTTTSPSDAGAIVANSGIYLGGTGSANKLDDYEEGTWTPLFGSVSFSSNSSTGTYTKIGDMVFCEVAFDVSSIDNTDNSSVNITNLPFSVASNGAVPGSISNFFGTSPLLNTGARDFTGFFGQISSSIFFDDASITNYLRYSQIFNTSGLLNAAFSYRTNA